MLTALQEDIPNTSIISSFDYLVDQLDHNDTFNYSKQEPEYKQEHEETKSFGSLDNEDFNGPLELSKELSKLDISSSMSNDILGNENETKFESVNEREREEMLHHFEQEKDAIMREANDKIYELQDKYNALERENATLKASQIQMSEIRDSLNKEKELDVLTIKKEMLILKEKQLQELRRDWNLQKEELARGYQQNLKQIQSQFANDRLEYEKEVDEAQERVALLKKQIYDLDRKSKSNDFQQQFDLLDMNRLFQLSGRKWDITSHDSGLISDLFVDFEAFVSQVARLEAENQRLIQALSDQTLTAPTHFKDIVSMYPKDFAEYIQQYKSKWKSEFEESHSKEIQNLMDQFEMERNTLKQEQRKELSIISSKLKSSCSDAYSSSVKQYHEKFEREYLALKQESDLKSSQLRNEISVLKSEKESLKRELEAKYTQSLALVKSKYVNILKQMKEDLLKSKNESLSRLETEWDQRKRNHDKSWREKLKPLESHLRLCHMQCLECRRFL